VEDTVPNHKAVGLGAYPVNPCWGLDGWWKPVPKTNKLFEFPASADLKMVLGWNNGCGNKPAINTYINVLKKGDTTYGENGENCDVAHTFGQKHGYCYIEVP